MVAKVFRVKFNIIWEEFNDGVLVLRMDDRRLVELNQTAGKILSHTNGRYSSEDIAQIMVDNFEIPFNEAISDIQEIYQELTALDIIE